MEWVSSSLVWAPPTVGIGSSAGFASGLLQRCAKPFAVNRLKLLFNEFEPVDTAHGALIIPKEQACHCFRPIFEPRASRARTWPRRGRAGLTAGKKAFVDEP
jgi:hypothetical protein